MIANKNINKLINFSIFNLIFPNISFLNSIFQKILFFAFKKVSFSNDFLIFNAKFTIK